MSAPFTYQAVKTDEEAIRAVASAGGSMYLAGGTTLIDLWKLGAMQPSRVVDINAVPLNRIEVSGSGSITFGALVRMAEAAANDDVASLFPLVAQSLLLAASPQIRNMASLGGNLLQRPRSVTYRGPDPTAIEVDGRTDAIFGTSPRTRAPHPSDFAVALTALDAFIKLRRPTGERVLKASDFFRVPADDPQRLTNILPGEMITQIELPAMPWARRSAYVKVRDRASYQFAIVSAAVAVRLEEDGVIAEARVAAGGVGTRPWRLPQVEEALKGRPADAKELEAAVAKADEGAKAHPLNAYKPALLKRTLIRAVLQAAAVT